MPRELRSFLNVPVSDLINASDVISKKTSDDITVTSQYKNIIVSLTNHNDIINENFEKEEKERIKKEEKERKVREKKEKEKKEKEEKEKKEREEKERNSFLERKRKEDEEKIISSIEEKLNMKPQHIPSIPLFYKAGMDNVKHYFDENKEDYGVSFFDLTDCDKDIITESNYVHLDNWEKNIEKISKEFDKTINDIKKLSTSILIGFFIISTLFIFNISIPYQFILLSLVPIIFIPLLLYFFGIKDLQDFEYVQNLKNKKCNPNSPPEFIKMNDLVLPESKKYKTNFNSGKPITNKSTKPIFPSNSSY